jgi:hypothetical protein
MQLIDKRNHEAQGITVELEVLCQVAEQFEACDIHARIAETPVAPDRVDSLSGYEGDQAPSTEATHSGNGLVFGEQFGHQVMPFLGS